jgi:hypothetical protein
MPHASVWDIETVPDMRGFAAAKHVALTKGSWCTTVLLVATRLHPAKPPPEQRAVVAVGGEHRILLAHRAGDPDRDGLLAERSSVGTEPPGALQRDGLQIEGARQHHAAIKGEQQAGVGRKARQRPVPPSLGFPGPHVAWQSLRE